MMSDFHAKEFSDRSPVIRLCRVGGGPANTDMLTLSALAAEEFTIRALAGGLGEHMILSVSGTVEMTQGKHRTVLTGGSNEHYFVRGEQRDSSSMSMREVALVFISFPQGIARGLSRWGAASLRGRRA